MTTAQPYRITRRVRLAQLESFCRSLQNALVGRYAAADPARIWRLFVSAECPACGMRVCGDELRALALPPCAELASVKIGRMRLGDCARQGCEAWQYTVHLWNQGEIDWPGLLEATERMGHETAPPITAPNGQWLGGFRSLAAGHAGRAAAMLGVVVVLWLAREFYLGGRIPFLREPENFQSETAPLDDSWPTAMEGS